ncbi:MAG: hypothetical protein A2915_01345 [Candidatus Yanofskybacteria bacterium RIFCSPLOWO2_01_FULL_41_34]|uniref:Uncharacterized protein n=1 Tax=Candidatus Yanofskybacteria bacterium RIFCSPHIGHO2_01_FULL_41_26 TaxID=1802661 RepID=A0A1F8EB84_9BACT|nr:MAG: hypothetical protein A2649_01820 [Candidatus Yanofskybacteria bacterium RIFCSPHIGHO2_01_FULL_41_26]OGN21878.1 MAG: hypothetical protein A2915_01345 [Candidatus Yanofskybacteria bacterium RIFCSPLOWO2_01_FULL_41_34]
MSSREYPLKHVRLEQLSSAGFNVADFICFPPNTLRGREEELKAFLAKHGTISCRHFHQDEKTHFKCPVKYEQTDFDTILSFCLANNEGNNEAKTAFYTLCNEAINVKESVCAGNILVLNEHAIWVEYFYGPGTPRDLESKGPDELKTYGKVDGQPAEGEKPPDDILRMVRNARKFKALDNKAYILEFSLYSYPMGRDQTDIICWEWCWGWLHYQMQANRFLLDQLKKANERITKLEEKLCRQTAFTEYTGGIYRRSSR